MELVGYFPRFSWSFVLGQNAFIRVGPRRVGDSR
jgi:hypothetical protein